MAQNLMILPTLACPASCQYCFGPHEGEQRMSMAALEAIAAWQKTSHNPDEKLHITFHGGEPLLAGIHFYRQALPYLKETLAPHTVSFSLQSNLWGLTDAFCDLFKTYQVSLGTSLDGPEPINDAQRGSGYFRRTMAGIQRARAHGLGVGCICTFTAQSAWQADAVFDFFHDQGLDFSIHAALPPLGHRGDGWALSSEAHGNLLVHLLDRYLPSADRLRISTLDALCQSVSHGRGGVCTFGDCLGSYLAVDPEGWIYPCQRFAGMADCRLGHVAEAPSRADLAAAPFWRALAERQAQVDKACADCAHHEICRGGCPYNVMAANDGRLDGDPRDPHCPAYQKVFSTITDRALAAVFSEENMESVVTRGTDHQGLLHKGPLLQIMRGGPHPKALARQARRTVAAAALGAAGTPQKALTLLKEIGVVTQPESALGSLQALQQELTAQSKDALVNAYVHITYRCNLQCDHCYASAGPHRNAVMPVDNILHLVRQSAAAGFGKAVLTGGEPLMHPRAKALLAEMAALRDSVKPLQTVLRTNLAAPLTPERLALLRRSTDQVVVSVDGDRTNHDARRGQGAYDRTVTNLKQLLSGEMQTELRLSGVLTAQQAQGREGEALRQLGSDLGVAVRIKHLLPLGRGAELPLKPDFYTSLCTPDDTLMGARPAATCGLGMNLYIAPDGEAYPCYTLMGTQHQLGNTLREGLKSILARNNRYRRVTVDSNQKCRVCNLRYLCGGFCRAWAADEDPNSPPTNCAPLYARAQAQLESALATLGVPSEQWPLITTHERT